MGKEIERKFLIKSLPDLSKLESIWYERYFIFKNKDVEIRIQKKGNKFELERKENTDSKAAEKTKIEITEAEYDYLKTYSINSIIRESYIISSSPEISLKIYHGDYEGLIRAEVEFNSNIEAEEFKALEWFDIEITNSPLGRDSKLIDLSKEEFKTILKEMGI